MNHFTEKVTHSHRLSLKPNLYSTWGVLTWNLNEDCGFYSSSIFTDVRLCVSDAGPTVHDRGHDFRGAVLFFSGLFAVWACCKWFPRKPLPQKASERDPHIKEGDTAQLIYCNSLFSLLCIHSMQAYFIVKRFVTIRLNTEMCVWLTFS